MNIKSLLLGSAAALAAVSGAQAADAIIAAEPEPMEYVRVCDAFGTGYFYIPGTETCLKIGGYVRFEVRGGDLLGLDTNGANGGNGDEWDTRSRFSFRVSTASDTELGALKTYVETRFNYRSSVGDFDPAIGAREVSQGSSNSLNFAYIDLAGFRVGKTESAFLTYSGYIGNVMIDDLIAAGPYDTHVIQYNYDSGAGFTGIVSLEDFPDSGNDYVPNVVAGLGYDGGMFSATVTGAFDSSADEGAIKGRIDGDFGGFSAFVMAGWSTNTAGNDYATWGGDWAVWGGISAPLTETIKLNTQLAYDDSKQFAANVNANFTVVPGFVITPEIVYYDDGAPGEGDAWGGMVRFQRSF